RRRPRTRSRRTRRRGRRHSGRCQARRSIRCGSRSRRGRTRRARPANTTAHFIHYAHRTATSSFGGAVLSVDRIANERARPSWYDCSVSVELEVAFLSRLPHELRDGASSPALAGELADLISRARSETAIDLDATAFAGYVAERATFDRHGRAAIRSLHAGALW